MPHPTTFTVANAADSYRLLVSGYSGTAGNAMTYHSGHKYTQHRIMMMTITVPPITKVHGGTITAMKQT